MQKLLRSLVLVCVLPVAFATALRAAPVSGSVILSATGTYSPGVITANLTPGSGTSTTSLTIDGAIRDGASSASLTITNSAVILTGNNTYSGGTNVSGGTLTASSISLPGNGTVTLTNSSSLIFNQTVSGTVPAIITGNGTLTKQGAGTLTLSGVNSYNGLTTVSGGTLVIGSLNLPGNLALAGNTTSVVFNQTVTGTYTSQITGTGAVVKQGAGELTVNNSNPYTGGTTISAGTLTINNIANIGGNSNPLVLDGGTLKTAWVGSPFVFISSPITVTTNNGAVNTVGGFLDLSGSTITGPRSVLTVTGGGTTTVSSALVTGLGGFVINSGTLAVNTNLASTLVANNFTINAGALLQINAVTATISAIPAGLVFGGANPSTVSPSNLSATLSGLITGNGTISFNGAGTLTLSNALNTFTGTFSAGAGSTILGDSSTIHGNVNSSGNITFNQTTDGTFGGNITGGGAIFKQGSANLTVTSSTSSAFNLQAGSLFLGNGTVGTTTVSAGSLLGGNGNVGGNLFNSGTLSPGFSPGTINVTGSYTQAPGSILVIQLASPVSFDKLIITGAATLGGTLQVDTLGGYVPATGQTFVFLTAASVTGTFNAVTGSAALLATVLYHPADVTLAFTQVPFASFALTPNQFAVATAAQASPALTTALNAVPLTSQIPAALDALSPQGYEVWSDIAFTHATFLADSLAREAGPSATDGRNHFYADGGQLRATTRGDLDVTGTTFTSSEGLVGGDRLINPGLSLGGFFAYGETTAGLGQPGGSTKVEDYTLGARAVWIRGPWFAHAVLAYDFDHYSSTRAIAFPGTAAAATSSTSGSQWTAGLSGGRAYEFGRHTLSPFASLLATGWQADHFAESGAGSLDATVAGRSAVSMRSQLGLASECNLSLGSLALQPHLRAAWQHEFADDARTINAAFGAVSYAVQTRAPQRDSALVGAGLDLVLNPRTTLYSNFSLQAGGSTRVLGEFRAGVSVNF